jgi:AraC-like DNA-binding protein
MHTLKLLWVDMTQDGNAPELPPVMANYCNVARVPGTRTIEPLLRSQRPDAVVFDFDYPDKMSLGVAASLKEKHPSIPMVMLTVQHSEALAVWSFRSHFADFLVRPVPDADADRCLALLEDITISKRAQTGRAIPLVSVPMPEEVPAAGTAARSLMPALHYIETNLGERITAEDMGQLCLMSPFRFSRAFRDAFGVNFRDYLLRLRLAEAARLLENPQAQVTQVAGTVGFNDLSHFSRMFKRHYGMTPSEAQESFQAPRPAGEPLIELPPLAAPPIRVRDGLLPQEPDQQGQKH